METLLRHALPEEVRRRLAATDDELFAADLIGRRGKYVVDQRRHKVEPRANEDGTVDFVGYATTWDTWYDVAGGPPYGWKESIARGAASKSLAERDDVRFLFDHDGIPMARTKSKTLTLESDDIGLLYQALSVDVMGNPFAAALRSALSRGDVDESSFAFMATRQEWNSDYTERRILEVRLFDVSAVTYPANPATIVGVRSDQLPMAVRTGMSLNLARLMAESLD